MKKPKMTNVQLLTYWFDLHTAKMTKIDRDTAKRARVTDKLRTIRSR